MQFASIGVNIIIIIMTITFAHKMLLIGDIVSETRLVCRLIENKRKDDVIMSLFAEEIIVDCTSLFNKALKLAMKTEPHTAQDEKELGEILQKVKSLESQCNHHVKTNHINGHLLFA